MDGTRPVRSRIDSNEDGTHRSLGVLRRRPASSTKVGILAARTTTSRTRGRIPTADGRIERIEISSTGDEAQIDRWEFYDVCRPAGPTASGPLLRVEEDTNGDGRPRQVGALRGRPV